MNKVLSKIIVVWTFYIIGIALTGLVDLRISLGIMCIILASKAEDIKIN